MKKITETIILALVALSLLYPAFSQERGTCDGAAMTNRVSDAHTTYMESLNVDDALSTFVGIEVYHESLGEIVGDCRSLVDLLAAGVTETGSGTIDDPYAFDFFANLGQARVRISQSVRPANHYVRSGPGSGNEWIVLTVDIQCVEPENLFCDIDSYDFSMLGDKGVVYDYNDQGTAPNRLDVELSKGGHSDGTLAFKIAEDESDLRVIYGRWSTRVFFSAEPAPGQGGEVDRTITVVSTTSLNIRTGAGRYNQRVGVLNNGEEATAIGRNDSGTWVQIDRGWVFAEYVNTSGDIMALPITSG